MSLGSDDLQTSLLQHATPDVTLRRSGSCAVAEWITSVKARLRSSKNLRSKLIALVILVVVTVILIMYTCLSCGGGTQCAGICSFSSLKPMKLKADDEVTCNSTEKAFIGKNPAKRLPQAIIFGVRKAGTRALLEFLGLHPDIVVNVVEQHFFSNDVNYSKGLEYYREQMPASYEQQITIEKTPKYFIDIMAPERIYRMNHSVKLILILRDPVVRLFSDYAQLVAKNKENNITYPPLEEMVLDENGEVNLDYKLVQVSVYYKHIIHWLEFFDLHQIHIVDGDKLIIDPYYEIYEAEKFLGVGHKIQRDIFFFNKTKGFYCVRQCTSSTSPPCLGETKGRQHPPVDKKLVEKLRTFFEDKNEKFFQLIHRSFNWTTLIV
ncbi:heparan sulfate glucosamine 3-O-sulfotransferase 1-like [Dreissena polymorpha]|uniref:Sulfotransferase domain-containing protein n=1 Tax=Dreissena polymorpha TaxID=45954 RepID=A0A9D4QYM5_DREPO|nr:heparan sulfate glucosamine 3-O-sulfotransferase 1-like [Dreissena polymorpha]KAH3847607.1 hypothetical protein DPMN_089934 [Dreissena polymorpha]